MVIWENRLKNDLYLVKVGQMSPESAQLLLLLLLAWGIVFYFIVLYNDLVPEL